MQVTPFLMFAGAAEEAMEFYAARLPGTRIESIARYGPGEPGTEGSVRQAVLALPGLRCICIDSPVEHAFTFTPATSLFVTVDDRAQLEALAAAFAEGGRVLMPAGDYGFSRAFAWVQDRFGVSWQFNLG